MVSWVVLLCTATLVLQASRAATSTPPPFHQCRQLLLPGSSQTAPVCVTVGFTTSCSVGVGVTAAGIVVVNENLDLSAPSPVRVCPSVGGCPTCLEVTPNGTTGACMALAQNCPQGTDYIELGCMPDFPLLSCLPCNCHGHGHCVSGNTCVCDPGFTGRTCRDLVPVFSQCFAFPGTQPVQVCGELTLEACHLKTTLRVAGNALLIKRIPLLQLKHEHSGAACVDMGVCQVCINLDRVTVSDSVLAGTVSGGVKCGTSLALPLGVIRVSGTFADLESRCFACPGNCSGHGKCNYDGSCSCTGSSYGSSCQFFRCPIGDDEARSECGGSFQGSCDAATGLCQCQSGYTGANCHQSQLTWIVMAAVLATLAVGSVVGYVVYRKWWLPRREAQAQAAVVNWIDEADAAVLAQEDADSDF